MEFVKEIAERMKSVRMEILYLNSKHAHIVNEKQSNYIGYHLEKLEEHDFYLWEQAEESGLLDQVNHEVDKSFNWEEEMDFHLFENQGLYANHARALENIN